MLRITEFYLSSFDLSFFFFLYSFHVFRAEQYQRKVKLSRKKFILVHAIISISEQEISSHENESELRANIKSLEEQVNYLTRILNESENNAARNEQQVAFLKEEIRRLQRVFEREPHLRNTEYLKNVLMKVQVETRKIRYTVFKFSIVASIIS